MINKAQAVSVLRPELLKRNSTDLPGVSERTLHANFNIQAKTEKNKSRLRNAVWETPELLKRRPDDTPDIKQVNQNSQTTPLKLDRRLNDMYPINRMRALSVPQIQIDGAMQPPRLNTSAFSNSRARFDNFRFLKTMNVKSYKSSMQRLSLDSLPFACEGFHLQSSSKPTPRSNAPVKPELTQTISTTTEFPHPASAAAYKRPPRIEQTVKPRHSEYSCINKLFSLSKMAPHRISVEHHLYKDVYKSATLKRPRMRSHVNP
jgi:hypothetical protein